MSTGTFIGTFDGMPGREQVVNPPQQVQSMTHLGVDPIEWGWRELRDYVISSLIKRAGSTQRKDPAIEASIFKGFINRHGQARAAMVTVYVLEVCEGRWGSNMITTSAFCRGSDPWFATKVLERINQ